MADYGPYSDEARYTTQPSIPSGETDLDAIFWAPDFRGQSSGATPSASRLTEVGNAGGFTGGVIDNNYTLNGHPSVREDLKEGFVSGWSDEPGPWLGFACNCEDTMQHGGEIWFRVWTRHEAGYSFDNGDIVESGGQPGHRKCFRLHNSSGRAVDFNVTDSTGGAWPPGVERSWRSIYEGVNQWEVLDPTNAHAYRDEQWDCVEVYGKIDSTWADGGWRMWVNNERVGYNVTSRTAESTSDHTYRCRWLSFWNGGVPKDQVHWWARPAVAIKLPSGRDDTAHMQRDGTGFPMIGMAT